MEGSAGTSRKCLCVVWGGGVVEIPLIHPCLQHSFQHGKKQSFENHVWASKQRHFIYLLSDGNTSFLIRDYPFAEGWPYDPV